MRWLQNSAAMVRIFALVVLFPAIVHAEPEPTAYVEPSLQFAGRTPAGGDPDRAMGGLAYVGLVGAMTSHGLWWRGGVLAGSAIGDITTGGGIELRAGIERRNRPNESGVYYGVDFAFCHEDAIDWPDEAKMTAGFAIPRAGVALGSGTFQFRLGLGVALGIGRVEHGQPDQGMPVGDASYHFAGGMDLDLGFVLQN